MYRICYHYVDDRNWTESQTSKRSSSLHIAGVDPKVDLPAFNKSSSHSTVISGRLPTGNLLILYETRTTAGNREVQVM